jgi:hypothetical protein
MDVLVSALAVLAGKLPVILVWLVGFILALVFWRRHPKVSLLTLIAIGGFLLGSLINSFLAVQLPLMLQQRGWTTSQIGVALSLNAIISSLLSAVFWGLLFAAIFGWRGRRDETARR